MTATSIQVEISSFVNRDDCECHCCSRTIIDGAVMLLLSPMEIYEGEICHDLGGDQYHACSIGCMLALMNQHDLRI